MDECQSAELRAFQEGSHALLGLIRGEQFASRTPRDRRARAEAKLARTRTLLKALGHPERHFPIVHVTGTSGKGSTSAMVAAILTAAGYRVGLRTSPYLQVPTEKLQIGSSLIDGHSFARFACQVLEEAERSLPSAPVGEHLGNAEAWTAMSMLWFSQRAVDVAVVEVGAGGRFDSTNIANPIVSVITSVGHDHQVSLGPTLADIAWHKAGIIKPGSIAIIGDVASELTAIFKAEAQSVGATVRSAAAYGRPGMWLPAMPGRFQKRNAQTAVAVIYALADQGFAIPQPSIAAGLASARLPGRLERMPNTRLTPVWIDGAHNEDKIAALASESARLTPPGTRPVFILGMLGSKDLASVCARLAPAASAFVMTQPTVTGKPARNPRELAEAVSTAGFTGPVIVDPRPESATRCAEEIASDLGTSAVVTGSIYLCGEVRRRWYPDEEIVLQRTPWPSRATVARSGRLGGLGRLEGEETDGQCDEAADHQVLSGVDQEAVGLQR